MITIIIADNDTDFLVTRAEYLEAAGYQVIKASTFEDAHKYLQDASLHHIDLIILDVRLNNDDDENDTSGLELAKIPDFNHIPKIILTGFPSYQYVRDVMASGEDGQPNAVNFIAKDEGPESMLMAVRDAVANSLQKNPNLVFVWGDGLKEFSELALLIDQMEPENLYSHACDLEDLLQRTFSDYDQVTLSRKLWQQSGRIALEAHCFSDNHEDQFVIVVGELTYIEKSLNNYQSMASQTFRTTNTKLSRSVKTGHYMVICWELPGINLASLQSLESYYFKNNERNCRQVLKDLFERTLAEWHNQNRLNQPGEIDLPSFSFLEKVTALAKEAVARGALRGYVTDNNQVNLEFHGEWQVICQDVFQLLDQHNRINKLVISPGSINPEVVLISSNGHTWLTDFTEAGYMPIWKDFAELETTIRFSLIFSDDLQGMYELDQYTFPADSLDSIFQIQTPDAELRKAAGSIQQIRLNAAQRCGPNPTGYYQMLLKSALNYLLLINSNFHFTRRQVESFLYQILFVNILVQHLSETENFEVQALPDGHTLKPLQVDEEDEIIWVGKRRVNLSPIEFAFFILLYNNRGALVRHSEIIKHFYPDSKDLENETSWITTTVHRLRRKLGDNRYILNVRKKGYRLDTRQ